MKEGGQEGRTNRRKERTEGVKEGKKDRRAMNKGRNDDA
jgi:hypothetical protein